MANKHETLSSLFSAIANAIRGKTGTSETIVADDFPSAIDSIETGVKLPELSNPAAAENIQEGFEAIDENGAMVTGTATIPNYTVEHGYFRTGYSISVSESENLFFYTTNPKRNSFRLDGSSIESLTIVENVLWGDDGDYSGNVLGHRKVGTLIRKDDGIYIPKNTKFTQLRSNNSYFSYTLTDFD